MGKKLPPAQAEIYKRCDEVLHYIWDPIGVSGSPGARDEYHAYLPRVFRMLVDGTEAQRIENYLIEVQVSSMGMTADKDRAKTAVDTLMSWIDWIEESVPK